MLRLYIIGVFILLIAIIANIIIGKIGLSTWYDFGPQFFKRGFVVMGEVGVISCIWLFVLYPIILGIGYLIGEKMYGLL